MFDFIHGILKWQFLNRIKIDAYFNINFAIGMARANLLKVRSHQTRMKRINCAMRVYVDA